MWADAPLATLQNPAYTPSRAHVHPPSLTHARANTQMGTMLHEQPQDTQPQIPRDTRGHT